MVALHEGQSRHGEGVPTIRVHRDMAEVSNDFDIRTFRLQGDSHRGAALILRCDRTGHDRHRARGHDHAAPDAAWLPCVTQRRCSSALCYINTANRRMSIRENNRGPRRPPHHNSDEQHPTRQRATDQEIQKWILRQHGFVPESAWLLHCKELFGLTEPGGAPTQNPCPPEKVAAIKQAFRRFGLL